MTVDYHDFTTIDTPREERRRLYVGDIYINAARCLSCGETIRSKNRHDFVTCSCGRLSVDGGSHYRKRSFVASDNGGWEDCSVNYKDVEDAT
jgi:hypothetical protein